MRFGQVMPSDGTSARTSLKYLFSGMYQMIKCLFNRIMLLLSAPSLDLWRCYIFYVRISRRILRNVCGDLALKELRRTVKWRWNWLLSGVRQMLCVFFWKLSSVWGASFDCAWKWWKRVLHVVISFIHPMAHKLRTIVFPEPCSAVARCMENSMILTFTTGWAMVLINIGNMFLFLHQWKRVRPCNAFSIHCHAVNVNIITVDGVLSNVAISQILEKLDQEFASNTMRVPIRLDLTKFGSERWLLDSVQCVVDPIQSMTILFSGQFDPRRTFTFSGLHPRLSSNNGPSQHQTAKHTNQLYLNNTIS
jgi:hypothetical protein